MNDNIAIGLIKFVLIIAIAQLGLGAYVFYETYTSNRDLVSAQRDGCERIKLDRLAQIAIEDADKAYFLAINRVDGVPNAVKRAGLARNKKIKRPLQQLNRRATLYCKKAYP